ncbi:WxL domain-containing protein [Levilactobacillus enshiensis]|uniref:WxL domain-containing protein n=1 Tax=Levilactobacillus enshiensis TaxID=2590213 RepID=UPI00117BA310|nr:WxL domain-containing protein [Levilactobacillus enshiensis]
MNKTVSSLLLAGALLLGSVAPVVANADGQHGTTSNSITFNKPDATTDPADPDNPGTKVPGGDHGGVTDPSGDLTFLYVSPKMQFGNVKGEAIPTTANAKTYNPTVTNAASVQVEKDGAKTDNTNLVTEVQDTRGSNAGWTVSVSADQMVNKDGVVLKGATLGLKASNAKITNSSEAGSGVTGSDVSTKTDGIAATDTTAATDGTTNVIYSAAKDSGMLTTAFQLDPSNITLGSIPANVKAGTYTGNLNWTLTDTPGA